MPGSAQTPTTGHHLGSHDAVAAAVASHQVAAGALSLPIYRRLLAEGSLAGEQVRILAESPPIPEYMWTFREGLSADLREALRQAFVSLREHDALAAYRAEAFIPAVDADVDRVRHWMEHVLQARLQPSSLDAASHSRPDNARAPVLSRRPSGASASQACRKPARSGA